MQPRLEQLNGAPLFVLPLLHQPELFVSNCQNPENPEGHRRKDDGHQEYDDQLLLPAEGYFQVLNHGPSSANDSSDRIKRQRATPQKTHLRPACEVEDAGGNSSSIVIESTRGSAGEMGVQEDRGLVRSQVMRGDQDDSVGAATFAASDLCIVTTKYPRGR